MLFFKISNPGNRDVIVNLPQLRLSNGYNVFLPDIQSNVNFPCKVTDGSCIYAWYPIHALQADLIKQGMKGSIEIQGIIEDQTNVTYKAKRKLTLDLV